MWGRGEEVTWTLLRSSAPGHVSGGVLPVLRSYWLVALCGRDKRGKRGLGGNGEKMGGGYEGSLWRRGRAVVILGKRGLVEIR